MRRPHQTHSIAPLNRQLVSLLESDNDNMYHFIIHSEVLESNVGQKMGLPQYSYYFVKAGFARVLKTMGRVYDIENIAEADAIYQRCQLAGEYCVLLSMSPPDRAPVDLDCPTVCVFAWEFDQIPNEVWGDDPREDWRYVFGKHQCTVPLSTHSADVVKKAMGEEYNVAAVPVPIWDQFQALYNKSYCAALSKEVCLRIDGNVLDSRTYNIGIDTFELEDSWKNFKVKEWDSEAIELGFTLSDPASAYLGGFYNSEVWGTWSRNIEPWILIPYALLGGFSLTLEIVGFGCNIGREIRVVIGDQSIPLVLGDIKSEVTLDFSLTRSANLIKFVGLDLSSTEAFNDPRTMGVGLLSLSICRSQGAMPQQKIDRDLNPIAELNLSGIVYTTVFNPADSRKNWEQIVTGFCYVFGDNPDVTLVLKVTHHDVSSIMGQFHYLLQRLAPFACRIVAVQGFFDQGDYEKLVAVTSFYVNASSGEGLCLPLMEFMSAGKLAIAPRNTAMLDFVSAEDNFVVRSSLEPSIWPHDPRQVFRALKYRIDWESIVDAYKNSYQQITNDTAEYDAASERVYRQLQAFCSIEVVKKKLADVLGVALDATQDDTTLLSELA